MDYKSMMGYGKKKNTTKKQSKSKRNQILEGIKKDLNEWNDTAFRDKPKRWSGASDKGLTEYEKELKEVGASAEYRKYFKEIEKKENELAKSVNNFRKLLDKKGMNKQATNLAHTYLKRMRDFNDYMKKLIGKLM